MSGESGSVYLLINQFLAIMGAVFCLVGMLLIIVPSRTLKIIGLLNVWVDTDRWFSILNSGVKSEAFIYRHHRMFGGLILLASCWILWTLVLHQSAAEFRNLTVPGLSPAASGWLMDSVLFLISLTSVFFMVLGLVIFTRPSLLKALERSMNRWVEAGVTARFNKSHHEADDYLARHPRLIGVFILCAGLYLVLSTAVMLFA